MKKALLMTALMATAFAAPALANSPEDHVKRTSPVVVEKTVINKVEKRGHDDGRMTAHYFGKMDKDGDGYVTKREHAAFAEKKFERADLNDDGKLTLQEVVDAKHHEKKEYKARYR